MAPKGCKTRAKTMVFDIKLMLMEIDFMRQDFLGFHTAKLLEKSTEKGFFANLACILLPTPTHIQSVSFGSVSVSVCPMDDESQLNLHH